MPGRLARVRPSLDCSFLSEWPKTFDQREESSLDAEYRRTYSIMHIRYALGVEEYYGGERRGVNKRYVNKKGGDKSKGFIYKI